MVIQMFKEKCNIYVTAFQEFPVAMATLIFFKINTKNEVKDLLMFSMFLIDKNLISEIFIFLSKNTAYLNVY